MLEQINHPIVKNFLREVSNDDLFFKWESFSMTQKFFYSVVKPLFEENLVLRKGEPYYLPKVEKPKEVTKKEVKEEIAKKTKDDFQCPYCEKSYPSEKSLGSHIRQSHSKEGFEEWKKTH